MIDYVYVPVLGIFSCILMYEKLFFVDLNEMILWF